MIALVLLLAGTAGSARSLPDSPVEVVRVETTSGAFEITLDRRHAPRHADAFVARACDGDPPPLVGTVVCRKQPGGYVLFGCEAATDRYAAPEPPAGVRRVAPEIDAAALGLDHRTLDDPAFAGRLWDAWIVPRALRQRAGGRPDPRLEELIEARRESPHGTDPLLGRSLQAIYEALGFEYRRGLSGRAVLRGVAADAALSPEGWDGRILVPLMPMPRRDGRTTVFGEVTAGLEVIETISRLPTDRTRAPAVRVLATRCLAGPFRPAN